MAGRVQAKANSAGCSCPARCPRRSTERPGRAGGTAGRPPRKAPAEPPDPACEYCLPAPIRSGRRPSACRVHGRFPCRASARFDHLIPAGVPSGNVGESREAL